MIAVRLEGRLGNQLFQYAFIYSAARKLNTRFYIDQSIQPFLLEKYFDIKSNPFTKAATFIFGIKGFKNLFSYYLKNLYYKNLTKLNGLQKIEFDNTSAPEKQLTQLKDGVLYSGFFQSAKYFEQFKLDINRLFAIKSAYKQQYELIVAGFPKNRPRVVIHVRRGDYLGLQHNLPSAYYHNALRNLSVSDPYYIFVSDDPNFVSTEFDYLEPKYVSTNSEIIDLQFLASGDICILSNSSFSWWGAWLNWKKDKKIFAPLNWSDFNDNREYPVGISADMNFCWLNV